MAPVGRSCYDHHRGGGAPGIACSDHHAGAMVGDAEPDQVEFVPITLFLGRLCGTVGVQPAVTRARAERKVLRDAQRALSHP